MMFFFVYAMSSVVFESVFWLLVSSSNVPSFTAIVSVIQFFFLCVMILWKCSFLICCKFIFREYVYYTMVVIFFSDWRNKEWVDAFSTCKQKTAKTIPLVIKIADSLYMFFFSLLFWTRFTWPFSCLYTLITCKCSSMEWCIEYIKCRHCSKYFEWNHMLATFALRLTQRTMNPFELAITTKSSWIFTSVYHHSGDSMARMHL